MTSTTSLIDRAGLDRTRVRRHLSRSLEGADDGELFLEYRQSEVLVFDNGRLKQATYDTAQGFGLRGDITAAEELMRTNLSRAQSALDAKDGAKAKTYLDSAEIQVEKIEKFLGR